MQINVHSLLIRGRICCKV